MEINDSGYQFRLRTMLVKSLIMLIENEETEMVSFSNLETLKRI